MTRLSDDALAALAADLERTPPEWAAAGAVCVPLSLLAAARGLVAELQERRAAEAAQRAHPEAKKPEPLSAATEKELREALRASVQDAPPPWRIDSRDCVLGSNGQVLEEFDTPAAMNLAVAAVNAAPALLAEVEALRIERDRLRGLLRRGLTGCTDPECGCRMGLAWQEEVKDALVAE